MELNELRDIWKEDTKKLEDKVKLNENLLNKMNMNKAVSEFDILLGGSILFRNLVMVNCVVTLVLAAVIIEQIQYSIPAILGAFAMLWLFVHHMKIEKPDYNHMSLLELQKSMYKFRIHSSSSSRIDKRMMIAFFLMTVPAILSRFTPIYESSKSLAIFCLFSVVYIVWISVSIKKRYEKYEQKLKRLESYLDEIMAFEKVESIEKDN